MAVANELFNKTCEILCEDSMKYCLHANKYKHGNDAQDYV